MKSTAADPKLPLAEARAAIDRHRAPSWPTSTRSIRRLRGELPVLRTACRSLEVDRKQAWADAVCASPEFWALFVELPAAWTRFALAARPRSAASRRGLSSIQPDALCRICNIAPNVSRKLVPVLAVDLGPFLVRRLSPSNLAGAEIRTRTVRPKTNVY